jgi:hypothetical protein
MPTTPEAPETLAELAWMEHESAREKLAFVDTESVEARAKRLQHARDVSRNIRLTMAFLRRMGWPSRWPRELMITHRGRE